MKTNVYTLLKMCVSSWRAYKGFCKETASTRSFLEWLENDKFGINFIKKSAENIVPYSFQEKAIKKIIEESSEGKTLLIEAPTASGKTEIPFIPFLDQLCTTEIKDFYVAPRLIYSLPLRSLSNIMLERACTYLLATLILRFEDSGKIKSFFKEKGWLKDDRLEMPIGLETGSLIKEGDYLYGGFITVGTMDSIIYAYVSQRFPGGLRNPRLSLPSGILSTSLLVLDEVQMLQDEYYYSPRILNKILRQLVSVKVPTIIMTATMPTILKKEIFSYVNYEEIGEKKSHRGKVFVDIDFLKSGKNLFEVLSRNDILKEIKENSECEKHSLIVTNKVSIALKIYEKVLQHFKDKALLIHGRLNIRDKEDAEKRIAREKGLVIVATQVIESGFDLDANLILTEVAPPDSLIQRIGRISRRLGESGKAYIVDVDSTEPYPEQLVRETKKELTEEGESIIENSLQNMDATKIFLDKIYKEEYVINFMKEKDLEFAKSIHYLSKLRLFSLPPEDVEFTFRPEMYVTFITMDDEIAKKLHENKEGKDEIEILREEFEEIKEKLEMNSLNVPMSIAKSLVKNNLVYGRLIFFSEGKKNVVKIKVIKDKEAKTIGPLQVWLLKPEAYESKIGIKEV